MSKRLRHPYPGLRAFERYESRILFGRQQQINELLDRLKQHKFLAVLGASGSGKSSLIKAGLLPGLEKGYMGEVGSQWSIAEMRPGDRPFNRLAEALLQDPHFQSAWQGEQAQQDSNNTTAQLTAELQRGTRSLHDSLELAPLANGTRLLILVDQFEEIFRYRTQQENTAAAFVSLLLEASQHPDIYIVITMRSDFLGETAEFHGLPEAINDGLYLTPRLTRQQLSDAIRLPVRLFGKKIDDQLVNAVLNDAGNDPDQLPLLQHALMAFYNIKQQDNPDQTLLEYSEFTQFGGLQQALNSHAEKAYGELNKQQQKIAETLFKALTERSDEGQEIRRPLKISDALQLTQTDLPSLTAIIDVFRQEGRNFLMPPPDIELDNNSVLDISHESLIRQWQRLKKWVAEESDKADMLKRLVEAAQRHTKGDGELWQGADLALALKWQKETQPNEMWASRYMEPLPRQSSQEDQSQEPSQPRLGLLFLKASQENEQQIQAEKEAQRQQEISRMRRQVLVAVVGFFIAVGLAIWGSIASNKAETATTQAELAEQNSKEQLFDSTLTHASLLTKVEDYAEARKKLDDIRKLDTDIPAQRRHARDLLAGYVDIMGGQGEDFYEAGVPLTGRVTLSPNNKWLAASGEQGTLLLFDMSNKQPEPLRLKGHDGAASSTGAVRDIAFHPNKDWLYSAGADGQIIRWQLPKQRETAKILQQWKVDAGEANALAISPDGKLLASGHDDDIIRLWQADSGKKLAELHGHKQLISAQGLSFNPSGKQLASASYDNTLRLWDIAKILTADCAKSKTVACIEPAKHGEDHTPVFRTSTQATVLRGHTNKVNRLAYGNNGKWLASASKDQTIRLWDTETGQQIRSPFKGHKNQVFDLQFIPRNTPYGKQWLLVSASSDNTIRLWDVDSGVTLRILQGHTAGVISLALAKDGKLYSASNDATIKRWSVDLPQQWLLDLDNELASAAIAPDGKHIAVSFANGTLQYYRIEATSPKSGGVGVACETNHKSCPKSVGSINSTNPTKLPVLTLLAENKQAHDAKIKHLAFNTEGTQLASGGMDNKAKIWNITTKDMLELHRSIDDHSRMVHAVSFSPNSKTLATASFDGQVGLFTVNKNGKDKTLFKPFNGKDVNAVQFSQDGKTLLSTGDEESKLWSLNTQPPSLIHSYPSKAALLWSSLSPDGKWLASVGREPVVKLHSTKNPQQTKSFIGHEQTILKVLFSPDSQQLATVSADMTVRIWDIHTQSELFRLRLPTIFNGSSPMWDFDFRCTPTGCWIAVPLTNGKLTLYNLGKIDY